MKIRFLVFSLFLSISFFGHAMGADKMETQRFDVLPTFFEVTIPWRDQATQNEDTFMTTADMGDEANHKEFFTKLGVTWPEGSEFSYLAALGKVQITNTPDNISTQVSIGNGETILLGG